MNYFQDNFKIIQRRWPDIASELVKIDRQQVNVEYLSSNDDTLIYQGIQLSSSYDANAEARLQCAQIEETSERVVLYGTGLGKVQELLLVRHSLQQLAVNILNLSLFSVELTHFNQSEWLSDKRVTLSLARTKRQLESPFIALPAELVLAEDNCALIRDKVCLALDDAFIASNNSNQTIIEDNSVNNIEMMKADFDIKQLPSFCQNKLANPIDETLFVIAAAGPTLEYHYSWLKAQTRENMVLLAVDATVKPLSTAGIRADVIVTIDKVASALFEQVDHAYCQDVPLVYFPELDAKFLSQWPAPRFASYSTGQKYDQLAGLVSKTRLYSGGSVIHPTIDLAVKMGAKNILLLGADFSLVNHQTHAHNTQILTERELLSPQDTPHWLFNGHNEKVPTYLNFRGYLRDLEDYIHQHHQVNFYTGSLDGAFIEGAPLWPCFTSTKSLS